MIRDVSERVKAKKLVLIVDEKVKIKLTREGYNPLYGARPLRRLITKYIEDLISENLLKNPIGNEKSRTVKIQLTLEDTVVLKTEQLADQLADQVSDQLSNKLTTKSETKSINQDKPANQLVDA
jgi:ATP-dependent Clp protease ATP-binding subunit ClpC